MRAAAQSFVKSILTCLAELDSAVFGRSLRAAAQSFAVREEKRGRGKGEGHKQRAWGGW